jgi:hypothetical protein
MKSLEAEIRAEIAIAMHKLGMPADKIALAERAPAQEISNEVRKWGAPIQLKALIGRWGDTLTDEELLHGLRRFNQARSVFD